MAGSAITTPSRDPIALSLSLSLSLSLTKSGQIWNLSSSTRQRPWPTTRGGCGESRRRRRESRRRLCYVRGGRPPWIGSANTIPGSRIHFVDLGTFDLDEESPLGPMRGTDASIYVRGTLCKEIVASDGGKQFIPSDSTNSLSVKMASKEGSNWFVPCGSVNFLSVKIVSFDVGFGIDIYGTVIARDNIDHKCVYLFRRDRDHPQLILSKDESLVVTGPKRVLALKDEIDLKIKGDRRWKDKQLSKGYLTLDDTPLRLGDEMVAVTYALVKYAVKATLAIEVLQGRFYGEITACTTSVRDSIVLYDSKLAEPMNGNGKGVIPMLRNVVAVCLEEKLLMTITARTGDGKAKITTIKVYSRSQRWR